MAGKSADDIGNSSGGWTVSWQGSSGAITPGTTILQGIRAAVGPTTTVTCNQRDTGIDRPAARHRGRRWMNSVSQQPINAGDGQVPLFAQGFGLTY